MGAAGVVESLLRTTARMPRRGNRGYMLESQVFRNAKGSSQTASVRSAPCSAPRYSARGQSHSLMLQRRTSGPHRTK